MQRFTLASIARLAGLGREHEPQGVDDVRACLISCTALAEFSKHAPASERIKRLHARRFG